MLKIAWNKKYCHPLPLGHRFPMIKYELLPKQLIYEGTINEQNLFNPIDLNENEILSVHSVDYWNKLKHLKLSKSEIRKSGFPLSKSLIEREVTINGGTLQATNHAFKNGVAMNIAGGTHHAYRSRAEGFCLLNDIAIAAQQLIDKNLARKILIVDLDVHQGNGTAKIFEDESRVFTFSMHGHQNYPLKKEKSDLDIPLENGTNDKIYLNKLEKNLDYILSNFSPDFIFFQCGVDVLATDKLGKLGLTIEGCKKRDEIIFETAKSISTPIVAAMGGGYSEDIKIILEAHANTYRVAQEIYF